MSGLEVWAQEKAESYPEDTVIQSVPDEAPVASRKYTKKHIM